MAYSASQRLLKKDSGMCQFDYLKIAKRREKIAKKYRVVRFYDADMQFRYKIQERFLWWSDVVTVFRQVKEYKEYNDAIAAMNEFIDSQLGEWLKKKLVRPCY